MSPNSHGPHEHGSNPPIPPTLTLALDTYGTEYSNTHESCVHTNDDPFPNDEHDTGTKVDAVRFGFQSNRRQIWVHWFLAILIGVSLRLTTLPEAMTASEQGQQDVGVGVATHYTRETSFLISFGFSKALSNLCVGWISDAYDRKTPHAVGWGAGIVLATLLLFSNSSSNTSSSNSSTWSDYLVADVFLGVQQGLTWTTNIFMLMDMMPENRALGSAISNGTGYFASSLASYGGALLSARDAFIGVWVCSVLGLALSLGVMEDTMPFVAREVQKGENDRSGKDAAHPAALASTPLYQVFLRTSWKNRHTSILCLAGLITNLVTSLAWGLVLIWGKQQSLPNVRLAHISSAFSFSKAASMLLFAHLSDVRIPRKTVLLTGFTLVEVGLLVTSLAGSTLISANTNANTNADPNTPLFLVLLTGGIATGAGIGGVYCVLTGAISDHTVPQERASAVGVYKFWRDAGYAIGGLLTGIVADLSGSFVVTVLVVVGIVWMLLLLITCEYRDVDRHEPNTTKINGEFVFRKVGSNSRLSDDCSISTESAPSLELTAIT